ncbi:BZ3500_MvSof-1268-A1-R1_Chr10-2g02918 [Microbotryum saponariae]|uniref:BZ3500_MvSof-1268-A1-R1_Chr10-2g02918 protein n=1 Tax=Microbotryum saponariae TaxID=289078 RepID=A0A2X0L520_9BASI|nr:BZ3501_MvSof-1269-A2-R1_Chr10-2g02504 [Microbotryum saponariae]SDA01741.1 BZ3500_MvSof-1268-A1-R1_Chr10-2g02918 [Microbotryum saponariae]
MGVSDCNRSSVTSSRSGYPANSTTSTSIPLKVYLYALIARVTPFEGLAIAELTVPALVPFVLLVQTLSKLSPKGSLHFSTARYCRSTRSASTMNLRAQFCISSLAKAVEDECAAAGVMDRVDATDGG